MAQRNGDLPELLGGSSAGIEWSGRKASAQGGRWELVWSPTVSLQGIRLSSVSPHQAAVLAKSSGFLGQIFPRKCGYSVFHHLTQNQSFRAWREFSQHVIKEQLTCDLRVHLDEFFHMSLHHLIKIEDGSSTPEAPLDPFPVSNSQSCALP